MGKGDKKTKARQARKRFEAMAGVALAEAPRREKDGKSTRKSRRGPAQDKGQDVHLIDKRAELTGRKILPTDTPDKTQNRQNAAENRKTRQEMRAQAYGDEAGRAICLFRKGEARQRLLDAYGGLCAAEARYHRSLGKSVHPKTAKIEMAPERFETSADDAPPDLRSEDERDRDAVNNWMRWKGYTMHLAASQRTAIYNAMHGTVTLHRGETLTPHGRAFVAAVEALAEVVG